MGIENLYWSLCLMRFFLVVGFLAQRSKKKKKTCLPLSLLPSFFPCFALLSLLLPLLSSEFEAMQSHLLRAPLAPSKPLRTAAAPCRSAADVAGRSRSVRSRVVPRAAMKDVAVAAADASGLTVKEAEAAVRAAFDFIAAEVRMKKGDRIPMLVDSFFFKTRPPLSFFIPFSPLSADLSLSKKKSI